MEYLMMSVRSCYSVSACSTGTSTAPGSKPVGGRYAEYGACLRGKSGDLIIRGIHCHW